MARCPAAEWKPISVNYNAGGCSPRLVILHIMEGTFAGTDNWFRNSAAQASAHFGVPKNGQSRQWVDTRDRAWHAANANGYAIGIENEGHAGDTLTPSQIAQIAKILVWANRTHGIPLQITNEASGHGLAYHGLGGADWGGHTGCPGAAIVAQRPKLITAAKLLLTPQPHPAPSPPKMLSGDGKISLHDGAAAWSTTVDRALWLMARDVGKAAGYGKLQAAYIRAGRWNDPMPAGMVYWVG